MSEKCCTSTRFTVFRVFLQRVVFYEGGGGGSADSRPAHNSRHKKCNFFMIFYIRKMLYFKVIRDIMVEKGGSTAFHPAYNSKHKKCYFLNDY